MKKLLVLMLVLGLVSAANAVISLSVNGLDPGEEHTINPSDEIVLDVSSDNSDGYSFWLYIYDIPVRTLSNGRVTQGNLSVINLAGRYQDYDYYGVTIADSGGALVPGTGFEVDFHCDGPGDVLVELLAFSDYALIDSLVIHQPEPMTIALLGLGGLFLRRRK